MSWVRLDDVFPEHPKVERALDVVGDSAVCMFVSGLCYCARLRTDGRIPSGKLRALTRHRKPVSVAQQLVAVGLWETDGGDYLVHDYLAYQPSAAKLKEAREDARVRKKSQRDSAGTKEMSHEDKNVPLARGRPRAGTGRVVEVGQASRTTAQIDANGVCPAKPPKPPGNSAAYARQPAFAEWEQRNAVYRDQLDQFTAEHFPGKPAGIVARCEEICRVSNVPATPEMLAPLVAVDGVVARAAS